MKEQVMAAPASRVCGKAWPDVMSWSLVVLHLRPDAVLGGVSVKAEGVVMSFLPFVTVTVYTTCAPSCGSWP